MEFEPRSCLCGLGSNSVFVHSVHSEYCYTLIICGIKILGFDENDILMHFNFWFL